MSVTPRQRQGNSWFSPSCELLWVSNLGNKMWIHSQVLNNCLSWSTLKSVGTSLCSSVFFGSAPKHAHGLLQPWIQLDNSMCKWLFSSISTCEHKNKWRTKTGHRIIYSNNMKSDPKIKWLGHEQPEPLKMGRCATSRPRFVNGYGFLFGWLQTFWRWSDLIPEHSLFSLNILLSSC